MKKLTLLLLMLPTLACASGISNPTAVPTSLPASLPLPGGATNYQNTPATAPISGVDGSDTAPAFTYLNDSRTGATRFAYPSPVTSAASTYNTSTNAINVANTFVKYQSGMFTTSGSLPSGLSLGTTYYVIPVDSTHFKVASSLGNAYNGTPVSFGTQGTGNHTFTTTWASMYEITSNGTPMMWVNPTTVYVGGHRVRQHREQLSEHLRLCSGQHGRRRRAIHSLGRQQHRSHRADFILGRIRQRADQRRAILDGWTARAEQRVLRVPIDRPLGHLFD